MAIQPLDFFSRPSLLCEVFRRAMRDVLDQMDVVTPVMDGRFPGQALSYRRRLPPGVQLPSEGLSFPRADAFRLCACFSLNGAWRNGGLFFDARRRMVVAGLR